MLDVTLRAETADDAPLLRDLYASTRAAEMAALPWDEDRKNAFLTMQRQLQTLHYRRTYPNASCQIVVVDGCPAGRLYVDRRDDEICVIDISLLPSYRRRGIGTALLRGLLSEARALDRRVALHVEWRNPARRLYERLGFRQAADEGVYLRLEWCGAASENLTVPSAGRSA